MAAKFSARRIAAFTALWRSITQARKPGAPGLADRVRALPRLVGHTLSGRYPGLGRGRLAMIGLAVAYLVSPVDLVPEAFLAVLGLVDDAIVALWLGGVFLAETDQFLSWERGRPGDLDPMVLDQEPLALPVAS